MPIEIRELVIKAFVDAPNSQSKKANESCDARKASEKMIQDSIDQFVEIIKQEGER